MERDFKGVWIAKEIWLDRRLNALDKIILAEIDSLDDGVRGCFASNQYIADFCQCSATKVSTSVSKLIGLGYIYTESFDGRTRILKSRLSNFERQGFKNSEAGFQDLKDINKDNNKNNNPLPPTPPTGEGTEADALFAKFWEAYPKKIDKKGSERAFKRIKKLGAEFEKIMAAVERQKQSEQWKRENGRFIPNPTTWLHQERWNDKVEMPPDPFRSFDPEEFFQSALERSRRAKW